jgi:F0F1-type ATP synthase assembly protein I
MNKGDINSLVKAYREATHFLTLGVQFAAIVVLTFFIGKWADDKLNTKPWLMLAGIIVGISASFYHFFKAVTALTKKKNNNEV